MAFIERHIQTIAAILRGERFDATEIDPMAVAFRNGSREEAFAKVHFREHAMSTLFYTFQGLFAYLAFGVLDFIYLPDGAWQIVLLIRIGTSAAMLAFISAWFLYGSKVGYHILPSVAMAVAGAGIIAMTAVMPAPENATYYAGLILVIGYFCNMPLLRFYNALSVAAGLVTAYAIVAAWVNPIPSAVLINNLFFLIPLAVWSLWINYWHQLYARQDYLHTTKLKDEAAKNSALFHEAQAANRAKSEFLAIMSHELRTPLNAILGFSDMMRSEIHGRIEIEEYRDYLDHVHDSGTHLLRVINDILDLSKADAGKLEVREQEVVLRSILLAVQDMVSPLAEEAQVKVNISVPDDLPTLLVDERMTRQIFINLVSNAVKFTPAGGKVEIFAGMRSDGGIAIAVRDTGIGIATEDIPRVLEPFVQADSTLGRRFEGTGLGLPLARKLAEVHGGSLEMVSRLEQGTTVTVTFPPERVLKDGDVAPMIIGGAR